MNRNGKFSLECQMVFCVTWTKLSLMDFCFRHFWRMKSRFFDFLLCHILPDVSGIKLDFFYFRFNICRIFPEIFLRKFSVMFNFIFRTNNKSSLFFNFLFARFVRSSFMENHKFLCAHRLHHSKVSAFALCIVTIALSCWFLFRIVSMCPWTCSDDILKMK